jgi:cytochrome bd-type quinol oxidase subunit 2
MNKDRKLGKILVYLSFIIFTTVAVWENFYYPNEVASGWLTVLTLFIVSLPMLIVGLIFIIKNPNKS